LKKFVTSQIELEVVCLYFIFVFSLLNSAVDKFDIPKSEEQCRAKLKEVFLKNKDVTDVRVIDMLVIKGQMELKEVTEQWKQKNHVMVIYLFIHQLSFSHFVTQIILFLFFCRHTGKNQLNQNHKISSQNSCLAPTKSSVFKNRNLFGV
jgi:hypothetical protein